MAPMKYGGQWTPLSCDHLGVCGVRHGLDIIQPSWNHVAAYEWPPQHAWRSIRSRANLAMQSRRSRTHICKRSFTQIIEAGLRSHRHIRGLVLSLFKEEFVQPFPKNLFSSQVINFSSIAKNENGTISILHGQRVKWKANTSVSLKSWSHGPLNSMLGMPVQSTTWL